MRSLSKGSHRMTDTLCPIAHRDDQPKPTATGLNVCRWHATRTERALQALPSLYSALEQRLVSTGANNLSGLPSGSTDPGLNLNHRVVQCRTDLKANLTAWTRQAITDRALHTPPDTVPAMCAFITTQINWYLAQPWTKQFVNDTLADWSLATALNDPNPVRMIEVGPCPEPDCDGQLTARIRPADSLLPHDVTCDQTPLDDDGEPLHAWTADKWLTLGRKITRMETA